MTYLGKFPLFFTNVMQSRDVSSIDKRAAVDALMAIALSYFCAQT